MKTLRMALIAALLTSCDFDVPNLNAPGIDSLRNPTPSQVEALAVGLLIGARKGMTERVGAVVEWGVLGREAIVLTPSDPRFINQLLAGSLSAGDANFGGNFWVIPYANLRGANLLLNSLDNPALVGLTDAQKEALRGFAQTMQAVDYLQVIDSHDVNGVVLDVNHDLGAAPGAIVTSLDTAYTFVETLLDGAQTHLTAAGATPFPFKLGSGFAGFDTPATFIPFNRALRARVSVYHGKFSDAITALAASFVDRGQPLALGVYHAFGAGSGDLPNDLNDTSIFCHDSTVTDAEPLPGEAACPGPPATAGGPPDLTVCDQRVQAKVKAVDNFTLTNHSSQYAFTLYPNSTSPIPIIRNEELILLRAEANIGLGNINNGAGGPSARSDINFIRTQSGGLDPVPAFPDAPTAIDELLKQKRYSLLFEGGHRWIDLRRYGKLDAAHVAVDVTGDVINAAFPLPLTETEARP
jgi:hypothetical protein